jgi:hypothetical protein
LTIDTGFEAPDNLSCFFLPEVSGEYIQYQRKFPYQMEQIQMKKLVLAFMIAAVLFLAIPGVTASSMSTDALVSTAGFQPELYVFDSPGVFSPVVPVIVSPFVQEISPVSGVPVSTFIPASVFPVTTNLLPGSYYEGTIAPVTSVVDTSSTAPKTWDDWFTIPKPSQCPLVINK